MAKAVRAYRPADLLGVESRGFLIAAPLALKLGCGFIMLRKHGKLPGKTIGYDCALEWAATGSRCRPMRWGPGNG